MPGQRLFTAGRELRRRLPAIALTMLAGVCVLTGAQSRPPDIPFTIRLVDGGASETAAFADINNDGRLDIVSSDAWYEAPAWTRRPIREIAWNGQYVDNFTDVAIDVDGDRYTDVVQFGYFSNAIVWARNPGKAGGAWAVTEIDKGFPTEFAQLVDLDNDGKARELLPQFDRPAAPLAWFDLQNGRWIKHVVSDRSYGHGIGAGDINGDKRADILTPQGWFEAPADPRAGSWTFHATDWNQHPIAASGTTPRPPPAQFGFMYALDVNGDSRQDVITSMGHDYGVCWFEQNADGTWTQRAIDSTWSQAHAPVLADVNGDGQLDLVVGKRFMAHNGSDPGEREPLGLYWYEFRRGPRGTIWTRHIIDYGGRMGGGMQTDVKDMDGDGDLDVVSGGKSGLFLAENQTRSPARRR